MAGKLRAGRNAVSQALSQRAAEENLDQGGRMVPAKAARPASRRVAEFAGKE
jgi:hypothetical protein